MPLCHSTSQEPQIVKRELQNAGYDITDKLVANKVFLRDWDIQGVDIDADKMFKLQNLYAIADAMNVGYLGRRQFQDLLDLLAIDASEVGRAAGRVWPLVFRSHTSNAAPAPAPAPVCARGDTRLRTALKSNPCLFCTIAGSVGDHVRRDGL